MFEYLNGLWFGSVNASHQGELAQLFRKTQYLEWKVAQLEAEIEFYKDKLRLKECGEKNA